MALKDLLQQVCQPLRRWLVWRQHKEIADGDSRNGAASLPSDSQVSRFGVSVTCQGGLSQISTPDYPLWSCQNLNPYTIRFGS